MTTTKTCRRCGTNLPPFNTMFCSAACRDRPARRELVIELWQAGQHSASQVAAIVTERFGAPCNRNMVIGIVKRAGLSKPTPSSISRRARQKQALPPPPPPETTGCTIHDLNWRTCRWPIGDPKHEGFHFCGATAPVERPYCEYHAAQAVSAGSEGRKYTTRRRVLSGGYR